MEERQAIRSIIAEIMIRKSQKRERRPRMDLSPANIARLEHVLRTLDFTQGADA